MPGIPLIKCRKSSDVPDVSSHEMTSYDAHMKITIGLGQLFVSAGAADFSVDNDSKHISNYVSLLESTFSKDHFGHSKITGDPEINNLTTGLLHCTHRFPVAGTLPAIIPILLISVYKIFNSC